MPCERDNAMSCEEAQMVSFLYLNSDPSLTSRQRDKFEAHLLICTACADEHEENRWLVEMLRQHWPVSQSAQERPSDDRPDDRHAVEEQADRSSADSLAQSAKGYRDALQRWRLDIARLGKTADGNAPASAHGDMLVFTRAIPLGGFPATPQ